MLIKNNLFFLLILSFFVSCTIPDSNSLLSDINKDLDSLKNIYAPDSRIVLWNISITNDDDKLTIIVEVDNNKAKTDLLKTLSKKYPDSDITVHLLPEGQKRSVALVNNSVSSIRNRGSHVAEIVNQALLGNPIKVLKKEKGWCLIQTPNQYLGWINSADIVMKDSIEWKEYKTGKKIIYKEQYGFSYTLPDGKSQVVTDLVVGCILLVIGNKKEFYEVK